MILLINKYPSSLKIKLLTITKSKRLSLTLMRVVLNPLIKNQTKWLLMSWRFKGGGPQRYSRESKALNIMSLNFKKTFSIFKSMHYLLQLVWASRKLRSQTFRQPHRPQWESKINRHLVTLYIIFSRAKFLKVQMSKWVKYLMIKISYTVLLFQWLKKEGKAKWTISLLGWRLTWSLLREILLPIWRTNFNS